MVVTLTVDEQGQVVEVELGEAVGDGFDEAALAAAHKLLFSPATVNGVPVTVQIRYTFRFKKEEKKSVAKPPPTPDTSGQVIDQRKPATIRATVYERGKGKRLAQVEVYLLDQDKVILTDDKGRFEFVGPPGAYAFTIRPPGFYPFMATERVEAGQEVKLKYFVRRKRRDRYSTIVWGTEGRAEVARTSLVDDEIRAIAGTMGDPIRVATLLPGASSSVSGLGYPIVRGSLPGDSLYEIDGIRIPMLYHLLFGPAVVHPRFVDEIVFQAGGYSAKYGGFPGARIGATTARVQEDSLWVADLSIVETSLFRSQKFDKEGEVVAAVRYGTLGYIIEGLASNTVFRYWDYQSRIGYRLPNEGKLTLTVLGASDAAGESNPATDTESVLRIGFHVADLRYQHALGKGWVKAGVQASYEFFEPPDEESEDEDEEGVDPTTMPGLRPYVEVGYALEDLELSAGGEALYQDFGLKITDDDRFRSAASGWTLGAWSAAEWTLGKLLINPSVRFDYYRYKLPATPLASASVLTRNAVDPRLSAAYDAHELVRVKASVGVHSGPSRFSFSEPPIVFGPVPAFEGLGLQYGLQKTQQVQLGVETKPTDDLEFNLTGFYHRNDIPVDFSLIDKDLSMDTTACDGDNQQPFTRPFDIEGRSYGAEMLLRRRLGRSVFGWASYAISRSEREVEDVGTLPFDFDQTHVFNGVLSWEVGRNWTLGGVFHYNTGRPYTPFIVDQCTGGGGQFYTERRGPPNSERLPNYWRIDVRIQKREVFETWFFDFYIDFFNAAFQFETIDYSLDSVTGEKKAEKVPLFVPMIGIRGEF
jgi:TonB family protein